MDVPKIDSQEATTTTNEGPTRKLRFGLWVDEENVAWVELNDGRVEVVLTGGLSSKECEVFGDLVGMLGKMVWWSVTDDEEEDL